MNGNETKRTIAGSVLTIVDKLRSDQNHSCRCTAYNLFAGVRSQIAEAITFTVKGIKIVILLDVMLGDKFLHK